MEAQEKWNRLTEQRREQLLQRHDDANTHCDWWDDVYEMFREDMGAIGVQAEAMYFSGFWSQGDGACFEGYVIDWAKFLTALGKPEAARILANLEGYTGVSLAWSHSGYYYHEHCTRFSADLVIDNPYDEAEQPLRRAAWETMYGADGPLAPLEDEFIEFLRNKMRDLYSRLEEEYEFLTSEEKITACILDWYEDEIDELLAEQEEEEISFV